MGTHWIGLWAAAVPWLAVAAIAAALAARIASLRPRGRARAQPAGPANLDARPLPARAFAARRLLSDWEAVEMARLSREVPEGYYVCPQVSLGQLLDCTLADGRARLATYRRVASKSVDFAIVHRSGRVASVLECNDRTHGRQDRKERDALVREALRQAGIPLFTIRPGQHADARAMVR